jgi:opacity protein-like surface antigen
MRKALLVALAVMMCGYYAVGQNDYSKVDLFGGFSVVHIDTEGVQGKLGLPPGLNIKTWYPGWEAAGQYNFTKLIGVKADFAGYYGTPFSLSSFGITGGVPSVKFYKFLFGPVFSFRRDRFTPFVHALFGGDYWGINSSTFFGTPSVSETSFGFVVGGGVDWKLTHRFAVRLGQFDYLYSHHCANFGAVTDNQCVLGVAGSPFADHQNNFRFSTGIVIHLR